MIEGKNKTVLAILLFAVIVSGCTGGQQNQDETSSTASIKVNEFSAFPNPAPSTQNTRFRMQIQNVGDSRAVETYVRLYNPPFADSNTDKKTWRDANGGDVKTKERTMYFGNLTPPTDQTPSAPRTRTLTFTAPELDEGRTISYDWNAYAMYQYNTSSTSEIQIMSGDKYRELGSPSGSASLENSRGPVKLEIRTPTPIVFYDIGGGTQYAKRDLCVIVRNKGSGVPFNDDAANTVLGGGEEGKGYNLSAIQDNKNKVNVRIEDIGTVEFRPSGSNENWGDSNSAETVEILSGKGVYCWDMRVDVGSSSQVQKTVPLTLETTYGYRKSTKTTATVEGRR